VSLQCRSAIRSSARNGVGPTLNGLFGRKSGTVSGYAYSSGNMDAAIVWDETVFSDYLKIRERAAALRTPTACGAGLQSHEWLNNATDQAV
jgi:cytochrome c2